MLKNKLMKTNKVVVVVSEGLSEKNLIIHLRDSVFNVGRTSGVRFKFISSKGKSFELQLKKLVEANRCGCDEIFWFTDLDVYNKGKFNDWSAKNIKISKKLYPNPFIISKPCIEGLCLDFLGKTHNKDLKKQVEEITGLSYHECYCKIFKCIEDLEAYISNNDNKKYQNYQNIKILFDYFSNLLSKN